MELIQDVGIPDHIHSDDAKEQIYSMFCMDIQELSYQAYPYRAI